MIQWTYGETEEKRPASGNYRRQLQELQEQKRYKRNQKNYFGKGFFYLMVLAACFAAMKASKEWDIPEPEAVVAETPEESLPAFSEEILVEELPGNVEPLPVTGEAQTPVETPVPAETPKPTPVPTETPKPTPAETPKPVASEAVKAEVKEYQVQPGDTLAKICREHYGSFSMVKKICELNEISDGDHIQPGEVLVLP